MQFSDEMKKGKERDQIGRDGEMKRWRDEERERLKRDGMKR